MLLKKRPTERQIKIWFIIIIDILLLIPFSISLHSYITKSYFTDERVLIFLDSVRVRTASMINGRHSKYIELKTWEGRQFRIFGFDGLKNESEFFEYVTISTAVVYSTRKSAKNYRERKGLYTEIKQIALGGVKYLDLDRINKANKSSVVRNLFIPPIIAVLITLYLLSQLLDKGDDSE